MIHWSTLVFSIITLIFIIIFLMDFFSEWYYTFSSKHKYSVGIYGAICIFMYIIFILIWGGFFWW